MKAAELRSVTTPEGDDISSIRVNQPFSVALVMKIGVTGDPGVDLFQISVCSPDWIEEQALPMLGSTLLIVRQFAADQIVEFLSSRISQISGATSREVLSAVSRLAEWEFEEMGTYPPRRDDPHDP